MKPIHSTSHDQDESIHREILLFTDTRFSHREFCFTGSHNGVYDAIPNLEAACWAGLLVEILPELDHLTANKPLFTWNILPADHFLWINQGTHPLPVAMESSIDPYFFLLSCAFN